jgi:hypothetical protein
MASAKKKTKARTVVKFRDLKSKKNLKGGSQRWGLKIDYGVLKLNPQPLPP